MAKIQTDRDMVTSGILRSTSTYGFTVGALAGAARVQYGSDAAGVFSLYTAADTRGDLYARIVRSMDAYGFAMGSIADVARVQYGSDAAGYFSLVDDANGVAGLWAKAARFTGGGVTHASTTLITTTVSLANNAGGSTGTLTNAPASGNPTKWIAINDNGVTRRIPTW